MSRFFVGGDSSPSLDALNNTPSEDLEVSQSSPLSKVNSRQSTSVEELSGTMSNAAVDAGKQDQKNQHQELLLQSFMYKFYVLEATQKLNQSPPADNSRLFTEDDPEIQDLARSKYDYMRENLKAAGILDPDAHLDKNMLEEYGQVVDYVSQRHDRALQESTGGQTLHRAVTALKLPDHLKAVAGSAPTSPPPTGHSRQVSIPGILKPLVDRQHPLIKDARVARDFVEIGVIGKGGYGVVRKVRNPLDGGEYAIKQIPLSPARMENVRKQGDAALDELLREVRAMQRLDHPNIVRYHNAWLEQVTGSLLSTSTQSTLLLEYPTVESSSIYGESAISGPEISDQDPSLSHPSFSAPDMDDNVVFEEPSAESTTELKRMRNRSESMATVSSNLSKKSTVHNAEEEEEDDEIETIPRDFGQLSGHQETSLFERSGVDDDHHLEEPQSAHEARRGLKSPRLILNIQMALYKMTLADFLSYRGEAPYKHCYHVQVSLQILLEILDGVQYLHAKGMAHRDLKPANIFLLPHDGDEYRYKSCVDLSTCNGCLEETKSKRVQLGVKIGDFGLVSTITHCDESNPVQSKAVGTEFYRPAVTSGRENAKLDVFALGVIAVELLWRFDTRMERAETLRNLKLSTALPADFTKKVGRCGDDIADCIKGMVCREETTRLSCAAVQQKLEAIINELGKPDLTA